MRNTNEKQFVYYADHQKYGELILVINKENNYREAFIYARDMVHERIKPRMNAALALELMLGPVGMIPLRYYNEAGFDFLTPFQLRMIALLCDHDENAINRYGEKVTQFILEEWAKHYP